MLDLTFLLQRFSTPLLDNIFIIISALTSEYVFFALLGYLYWCRDKHKGFIIGITLLSSFMLNTVLKNIFRIPRPYVYANIRQIDILTGYGYSFPSGHAQLSTTFAAMCGAYLRRRFVYISGVILVILTGISRIYLGVHTPVDIIAGIIIGSVWSIFGCLMLKYPNKANNISLYLLLASYILLIFIHNTDLYKMTGFLTGFVFGNIIENKYIKNDVNCAFNKQVLKMISGIIIVICIKLLLSLLKADKFVQYMAIGIVITVIIPILSKKFLMSYKI